MKNLVLGMLAMAAMVSCSSENDPINEIDNGKDPIAISFGQNIEIYTKAPITDATLPVNSKIGLWATEYMSSSEWKAENKCDNKQLNVTASGIAFEGGDIYYSKVPNTKYDFYAYTPFAEEATNGLSVNAATAGSAPTIGITLKADPSSQIDLMYATPLTGKTAQTEAYELAFNHALAQVKFTIKKEAGVTLGSLTAISVSTKSKSSMSLSDGSFAAANTEIAMTPLTSDDTPITLGEAAVDAGDPIMVFPEAGVIASVAFTIDGETYSFVPSNVTLTKNKITTIDVTITATGLTFTQKINQWVEDSNHGTGTI